MVNDAVQDSNLLGLRDEDELAAHEALVGLLGAGDESGAQFVDLLPLRLAGHLVRLLELRGQVKDGVEYLVLLRQERVDLEEDGE